MGILVSSCVLDNGDIAFVGVVYSQSLNGSSTQGVAVFTSDINGNIIEAKEFVNFTGLASSVSCSNGDSGLIISSSEIAKLDKNLSLMWAKGSKDIEISDVIANNNRFLALGNFKNNYSQFYLIKGDSRKFDLKSFSNVDLKENKFIFETNEFVKLTVKDVKESFTVTSSDLKLQDIKLEKVS